MSLTKYFSEVRSAELSEQLDKATSWKARLTVLVENIVEQGDIQDPELLGEVSNSMVTLTVLDNARNQHRTNVVFSP